MATLVIDLQGGFSNDTISIRINGKDVFQKDGVTTDYSIGRADSVETPATPGKNRIEVTLPARRLAGSVEVETDATKYVGVSLQDDRIEFRISDEMFYYF